MDCVVHPEECTCDCHRNPGMKHPLRCCDGMCPFCRRYVAHDKMYEHVRDHHPDRLDADNPRPA